MKNITSKLFDLAYFYAEEINNYEPHHLRVELIGERTLSVGVRTENNFGVCDADVPLADLQWREVKKLTKRLQECGGWIYLSLYE